MGMRRTCVRWLGLCLTALFSVSGASAKGEIKGGGGLMPLLRVEGVDSSYAVNYLDANGKAMTAADFTDLVMRSNRLFTIKRDTVKHTAQLRLEPANARLPKGISSARHVSMLKPGESIPPFHLVDLDGHVVDKASLHGHTVLINFYFSTCAPCVAEIPVLTAYAREHPHMRVIAVTFDDAKTSRSFVSEHHFGWPVLTDGMGFISAMGVDTYPAMALVGPDGRLLRMTLSADIGHDQPLTVEALTHWVDRSMASASSLRKR